jgi:hypothetical protein
MATCLPRASFSSRILLALKEHAETKNLYSSYGNKFKPDWRMVYHLIGVADSCLSMFYLDIFAIRVINIVKSLVHEYVLWVKHQICPLLLLLLLLLLLFLHFIFFYLSELYELGLHKQLTLQPFALSQYKKF